MSKVLKTLIVSAVFSMIFVITSFAGTWKQDAKGWRWDYGNGTWPAAKWEWCDGNGDGIAECYYFTPEGYCLMNCTTPDGYLVNASGAWIVDNVVQTKRVSSGGASGGSVSSTSAGGSATGGAVLSGQMNGTYHVTSTIPWDSRWETLVISDPEDYTLGGGETDYKYSIKITSAKDGRTTRLLSKPNDGVSYRSVGGQNWKQLFYAKGDPTLTFVNTNTFTLSIPDERPESIDWSAMNGEYRPLVTFTWVKQ